MSTKRQHTRRKTLLVNELILETIIVAHVWWEICHHWGIIHVHISRLRRRENVIQQMWITSRTFAGNTSTNDENMNEYAGCAANLIKGKTNPKNKYWHFVFFSSTLIHLFNFDFVSNALRLTSLCKRTRKFLHADSRTWTSSTETLWKHIWWFASANELRSIT